MEFIDLLFCYVSIFMFITAVILFTIFFILKDRKERKNEDKKKNLSTFIAIYFAISLCLFVIFIFVNYLISLFIILHLFFIALVSLIIAKKTSLVIYDCIVVNVIGLFLWFIYVMNISFNYANVLWLVIGIGIYLLPALGYFDHKKKLGYLMKKCTEEVTAEVKKVYKTKNGNHSHIYVPKVEFTYNDKKYTFMNSTVYSNTEIKVGEKIKLFIDPNNLKFYNNGECDNVFWLVTHVQDNRLFETLLWYGSTIAMIVFALFLIYSQ